MGIKLELDIFEIILAATIFLVGVFSIGMLIGSWIKEIL